jgi:two-component system chemotaxis response regulator CheY
MGNKTILIVDDSVSVRQQVSKTLCSAGYDVLEASNGREGIEVVRSGAAIALVICDLNMPVANGLEFVEGIKNGASAPPVPVVMLTTDASPERIAQAKRAGAKGWIVKPFRTDLLLAAVRRIAGEPVT